MTDLPRAFALAMAQIGDPAILKVLAKSILITVAIFLALGGGSLFALYHFLISLGFSWSATVSAFAAMVLTIVAGWLLFRVVALAVVQFFAEDIVRAVEARHYPAAAAVPDLPFARQLAISLRGVLRALIVNLAVTPVALVLLFTGIGTALVYGLANAFLIGRELMDMVWLRHRHGKAEQPPMNGATRMALGGIVTALLLVPFANLLAPVLGAAAAAHLVHRQRNMHAPA